MGKFFAVLLIIITLISVYPIVTHMWWMPAVVSAHGPEVDHQLDETMVGSGILFVTSQFVLAGFIWAFGNHKGKIKNWPGGHKPVVAFGIILVGLEILSLSFVGSKVWASMYIAKPDPRALHVDVQAEQFAFFFRYAGPDGVFGGIHPDKINDGNGNYFGLDPENDVAARDDIVVGIAHDSGGHPDSADPALQGHDSQFLRAGVAHPAGHRPGHRYSASLHRDKNGEVGDRLHAALWTWATTA